MPDPFILITKSKQEKQDSRLQGPKKCIPVSTTMPASIGPSAACALRHLWLRPVATEAKPGSRGTVIWQPGKGYTRKVKFRIEYLE